MTSPDKLQVPLFDIARSPPHQRSARAGYSNDSTDEALGHGIGLQKSRGRRDGQIWIVGQQAVCLPSGTPLALVRGAAYDDLPVDSGPIVTRGTQDDHWGG